MDIESILDSLGLDLTNPEVRRGALEAIDAILDSRQPAASMDGMAGGMSGEQDIEIDPDLLQPSIKNRPQESSDDIEINDEEDILKNVKHNEDDDSEESPMSNDSESGSSDSSSSETGNEDDTEESDQDIEQKSNKDTDSSTDADDSQADSDSGTNNEQPDKSDTGSEAADTVMDDTADGEEADTEENSSGAGGGDENDEDLEADSDDVDDYSSDSDYDEEDTDSENSSASNDAADGSDTDDSESTDTDEGTAEDEFDFDEDELLDDSIKDTYEDQAQKAKHEARRIKRERTLQAAKKVLADAQAKNKAPALIRELEKAIEALEGLKEAVEKTIRDLSDEEFNIIVNRVFDAIDALGDSGLTYSSDEERKLKAQEIKADIEDRRTQAELSAEDVAKIRAETQAIKAREKETAKYQRRSRGSFKGFQDFLSSLYRAIALQVHVEETRDDSWSAISRRNSGAGVLQQGKKVNELPNKKIPVIDFYFDQSGSWDKSDIKVGEKAVAALADMEEKGQIKVNIYYFANNVHTDAQSARNEGGTWAWNDIVKNVIATQATNVVIMTDSDMEDRWDRENYWSQGKAASYTVPGYVWYLWRYGDNAPRLPRDLRGRGGTQQFSFGSGDV